MTDEQDKEDREAFEIMDKIARESHARHVKIGIGPLRPGKIIMSRETWEELCALGVMGEPKGEDKKP